MLTLFSFFWKKK